MVPLNLTIPGLLNRLVMPVLGFAVVLQLTLPGMTYAQETLRGYVEQKAQPVSDKLQGQVVDAKTGEPVPDAQVTLPDSGFSMRTGKNGEYQIPRHLGKSPVIMSVQKPGYAPFSLGITENAPPVFTIRLQQQAKAIILDEVLRHLGDGSFSPYSSGAGQFRKPPDGPAIRIPFTLSGVSLSTTPYLQIGSIVGIDTQMSHYLTGNNIGVSATPLLIKLNGETIARISVNGDNQKLQLPRRLLSTTNQNILEIESGWHDDNGYIDYDDMELMHLVFYP